MSSWKDHLKEIVDAADSSGRKTKEEGQRVKGFLGDVVVPAFEAFAQQLQELERDVQMDLGDRKAQLLVLKDGEEEFFFEIRIRAYRKRDFAFPVIPLRDSEGDIYRAEASIRSGSLFHDLTDYSREGLLDVLVTEYGRHLRWER